jgi:membrane associated rhomboid family serine protease
MQASLLIPNKIAQNPKNRYRLFSAALVHSSLWHLLANMLTIYFLGRMVEHQLGATLFLFIYITAIFCSSYATYLYYKNDYRYASLGASGGVSGIAFAFIALNPKAELALMFIPIYFPAWVFGLGFIGISSYFFFQKNNRINHLAHIMGGLTGLIISLVSKILF